MKREQKLEAMARAWCDFNGWVPDHRPLVWVPRQMPLQDGTEVTSFDEEPGKALWQLHLPAMRAILKAIEKAEEAAE